MNNSWQKDNPYLSRMNQPVKVEYRFSIIGWSNRQRHFVIGSGWSLWEVDAESPDHFTRIHLSTLNLEVRDIDAEAILTNYTALQVKVKMGLM